MPNGKPGDHPLTDICNLKLLTFSEEADNLIRESVGLVPKANWWSFLYCFYQQDSKVRVAGYTTTFELPDFANLLREVKQSVTDLHARYQGDELIAAVNSYLANRRSTWLG